MPLKYLTPEHQAKLMAAVRGRKLSPEHKEKIGAAHRGRKKSPEQVEKTRLANLGKKRTPEQKAAMSARRSGKPQGPYPPERGEAIRAALLGRTPLLRKYGITTEEYAANIVAGNKWCSYRKHFAPAGGFQKKSTACESCAPEYQRATNLRIKFGVDQSWYESKLADQGGVCAICRSDIVGNKSYRFFAIDHDHATGGTRGLLCSRCNTAIERVESVIGWCDSATAYLDQYKGQVLPNGNGKTTRPYKSKAKALKIWNAPIVPPLPVVNFEVSK